MRRAAIAGAVVAGGAVAGAARTVRQWQAAENPCGPDGLALPPGEELKIETSDGAVLATHVAGEGPTVVLSHGWTNDRTVWGAVARRLVDDGHRVVAFDHRGHGGSTVGEYGFAIERLGADLREVLEHVDATDAVLAGHSMGGMTVQAFAAEHADARHRSKALVLVATAAHGLGGKLAQADAAALRLIAHPNVERALKGRMGPVFVRNTVGKAAVWDHLLYAREAFLATGAEVRREFLRAMQSMDLRPKLRDLDVPATVVIGSRDRLTPPKLGRHLADTIGAEVVELPGHGHMLPLEAPERVAAVIAGAARA